MRFGKSLLLAAALPLACTPLLVQAADSASSLSVSRAQSESNKRNQLSPAASLIAFIAAATLTVGITAAVDDTDEASVSPT